MYASLDCISRDQPTVAALTTLIAAAIVVIIDGSLGLVGRDARAWACTALTLSVLAFLLFFYVAVTRNRGIVMKMWLAAVVFLLSLTITEVAGVRNNIGLQACEIAVGGLILSYIILLRLLDRYNIISWNKWVIAIE